MNSRTLVGFDWAARKILRDKAHFDILEGFLNALLKQEIKIITLWEGEIIRDDTLDKFNSIALIVEDQNKELALVEIQNNREMHYYERKLHGAPKLIVAHRQLEAGHDKINKIIAVRIFDFPLGDGETDYLYYGATEFYGLHDHSRLVLKPAQKQVFCKGFAGLQGNIFPEYYLIAMERFQNFVKSDLDEWIYYFKNAEIKENFKARNIQLLQEKLALWKMPEAERRAYERFMMNKASERGMFKSAKLEGFAEGLQEEREARLKEGHEAGLKESRFKTARAMLADGEPLEKIKRYTRLSEQEILQLQPQT